LFIKFCRKDTKSQKNNEIEKILFLTQFFIVNLLEKTLIIIFFGLGVFDSFGQINSSARWHIA